MGDYSVRGFKASVLAAGIKKRGGLDLALIFSEREASAAGVFTGNKVKAAPVLVSQENIKKGRGRAIVANSGNANACTGEAGLQSARFTVERVAKELGIGPEEVLVASTGVIGAPLNTDVIGKALPELVKGLSADAVPRVVEAIMTTDSFPKLSLFEGKAGGKSYKVVGMAKGAGMIMPDMATMLCFILTDIAVDPARLNAALVWGVERTFNRISVDGDMSTNDTVFVLANGAAGNGSLSPEDFQGFRAGLAKVMDELSTMIVRDGEGATKLIRIAIKGAATSADALAAARTVANSSLVKTAFYGSDPNWGRIMAALGRSGIRMREEGITIWVDDVKIVEEGMGRGAEPEAKAAERMKGKEFSVTVDLHEGKFEDHITTCDLTHEYVSINANYRT
ncbi:MAG: argJ [Deltaproteobacteria bacterium]|jgi:glutamate N-acetyltransferase/amino-acid N-acetyltransferase|nr:argJ [Deltaproteobacteria bacterium]